MWIAVGILTMVGLALLFVPKVKWQFPALVLIAALFLSAAKLGWIRSTTTAVIGLGILALGMMALVAVIFWSRSSKPATVGTLGLAVGIGLMSGISPSNASAQGQLVQYFNGHQEVVQPYTMVSATNEVLTGQKTSDSTAVPSGTCNTKTKAKEAMVNSWGDLFACINALPAEAKKEYIKYFNDHAAMLGGSWSDVPALIKREKAGLETRAIVVMNASDVSDKEARKLASKVIGKVAHKLPVVHLEGNVLTSSRIVGADSLHTIALHQRAVRVMLTMTPPTQKAGANMEKARAGAGVFVECINVNPGFLPRKPKQKPPVVTKTAPSKKPVASETPTPSRPTSPTTTTTTTTTTTLPPTTITSTPPTATTSTPPTTTTSTPPTTTTSTPPTTTTSTPPTTTTSTPPTTTTSTPPTTTTSTPPTTTTPPTSETPPTKNPTGGATQPTGKPNDPTTTGPVETDPSEPTKPAPEPTKTNEEPTDPAPSATQEPTREPKPSNSEVPQPTKTGTIGHPDDPQSQVSETPVVVKSMSTSTPPAWMVMGFVMLTLILGGTVVARNLYQGVHRR